MARSKRPSKRSRSRVRRRTRRTRTRISRQRSPKRRVSRRRYRGKDKPLTITIVTVINDIYDYIHGNEQTIPESLHTFVSKPSTLGQINEVNDVLLGLLTSLKPFTFDGEVPHTFRAGATGDSRAPVVFDPGAAQTLVMFKRTLQLLTHIRRLTIAVGDERAQEQSWRRKMALTTIIFGVLLTMLPFARVITVNDGVESPYTFMYSGMFAASTIIVTLTVLISGNAEAARMAPHLEPLPFMALPPVNMSVNIEYNGRQDSVPEGEEEPHPGVGVEEVDDTSPTVVEIGDVDDNAPPPVVGQVVVSRDRDSVAVHAGPSAVYMHQVV